MFKDAQEILAFAIQEEEDAVRFYRKLAEVAENTAMRKTFEGFAREEESHKQRLMSVQQGEWDFPAVEKVMNLKIAEYLRTIDPFVEGMDYQQALVVAMQKERAAFVLYTNLANATENPELRALFENLAQEEARHKLRFEIEYDDGVLIWN